MNTRKKTHIRYKGRALCGNKRATEFVTKNTEFDDLPDKEKCKRCDNVSSQ